MITFTPDGRKVLTADEGEPNDAYTIDPEGSVSIVDISGGVRDISAANVSTITFAAFNGQQLPASIRVYGPKATVAQYFEPEYVAVSIDSRTAYVTLQENNAIAVIDIDSKRVLRLMGLGFKDHSKQGAGIDASDRDDKIDIRSWPVYGMYQPDAIAVYETGGKRYLVTANEGDAQGWTGFNEEARVSALRLDSVAFPNAAELQRAENLGRLTVTSATGDYVVELKVRDATGSTSTATTTVFYAGR
jgi:DNA-binding beta-propeller fold protein YncE